MVRAAILRTLAAPVTGPTRLIAAWAEIDRLVAAAASGGSSSTTRRRNAGARPFPPCSNTRPEDSGRPRPGSSTICKRVCVDHEREVFRTDLIGWALSLGRQPVRRELPHLREVMISSHLRGAFRRLQSTRLGRIERRMLSGLLAPAVRRAEDRVHAGSGRRSKRCWSRPVSSPATCPSAWLTPS